MYTKVRRNPNNTIIKTGGAFDGKLTKAKDICPVPVERRSYRSFSCERHVIRKDPLNPMALNLLAWIIVNFVVVVAQREWDGILDGWLIPSDLGYTVMVLEHFQVRWNSEVTDTRQDRSWLKDKGFGTMHIGGISGLRAKRRYSDLMSYFHWAYFRSNSSENNLQGLQEAVDGYLCARANNVSSTWDDSPPPIGNQRRIHCIDTDYLEMMHSTVLHRTTEYLLLG